MLKFKSNPSNSSDLQIYFCKYQATIQIHKAERSWFIKWSLFLVQAIQKPFIKFTKDNITGIFNKLSSNKY